MRIAQLANFYGPRSGGLRTALHELGAGSVRPGAGAAVADRAEAFAAAVSALLEAPEPLRRAAARTRAEQFPWPAAVGGMLAALRA